MTKKSKVNEDAVPVFIDGEYGGIHVTDQVDHPTILDVPDVIDTTDGTIIYKGYIRNEEYIILRTVIEDAIITNSWASGDWEDREDLF